MIDLYQEILQLESNDPEESIQFGELEEDSNDADNYYKLMRNKKLKNKIKSKKLYIAS